MEQERKTRKKRSVLKKIKYYFTSEEKEEALLLDYMQKHPELTPEPPPPPDGEFQKIMKELDRRESGAAVKRRFRKLSFVKPFVDVIQKPILIALGVVLLFGYILVGVSA